jgi:hypothetical protein
MAIILLGSVVVIVVVVVVMLRTKKQFMFIFDAVSYLYPYVPSRMVVVLWRTPWIPHHVVFGNDYNLLEPTLVHLKMKTSPTTADE